VKHAWSFNHRIDFDIFRDIYKISFCVRKTLEAWHTSDTKHADNNYFALSCLSFHIFFHSAFHFYPLKAVDRQLKVHITFSFLKFLGYKRVHCNSKYSYCLVTL